MNKKIFVKITSMLMLLVIVAMMIAGCNIFNNKNDSIPDNENNINDDIEEPIAIISVEKTETTTEDLITNPLILSYGDKGDDVKDLQMKLRDIGLYTGDIDGSFGPMTRAAVNRLQENCNINPDGVVQGETWAVLDNALKSISSGETQVSAATQTEPVNNRKMDPYFDIFVSGIYHWKFKAIGENEIFINEYYRKDDIFAVTSPHLAGESGRMIFRDGKQYNVNDSEKAYGVINWEDSLSNTTIEPEKMLYIGNGMAEFNGEILSYEDYEEENKNILRFFFNGDVWVGTEFLETEFLSTINLELDQNVPDDIFNIPNDYSERIWWMDFG